MVEHIVCGVYTFCTLRNAKNQNSLQSGRHLHSCACMAMHLTVPKCAILRLFPLISVRMSWMHSELSAFQMTARQHAIPKCSVPRPTRLTAIQTAQTRTRSGVVAPCRCALLAAKAIRNIKGGVNRHLSSGPRNENARERASCAASFAREHTRRDSVTPHNRRRAVVLDALRVALQARHSNHSKRERRATTQQRVVVVAVARAGVGGGFGWR